ncbi:unnamed protein product [Camellia sinensis]
MLSNATLDSVYGLRRRELRRTIQYFYSRVGSRVNVGEQMFLTVMNVITNMLWGGTVKGEERGKMGAEFRQVVAEMTELLGKPNLSDFFPGLARFDLQGVQKQMKGLAKRFDRIFENIIDQRLKMDGHGSGTAEESADFLQFLLKLKDDGDAKTPLTITHLKALLMGYNNRTKTKQRKDNPAPEIIENVKPFVIFTSFIMTENILQSNNMKVVKKTQVLHCESETQVLHWRDMVVGGTDTTSNTVEFALAEMMNKSQVLRKAQQEVETVVGKDNIVEESHIHKLPYLYAVMKETLRLHPALPLLVPHCPTESCIVGGYTVPKGARVFVNVWAVHRDPSVWTNPLEFDPERFLGDSKWDYSGNDFNYFPFGSGRRISAGTAMAERMFMFSLASLVHSFDWKLPEGEKLDLEEKFGIVLKKKVPLVAIPTPRLSDPALYE